MDVALRRLQAEDIDQVVEIEKEAFSPLWVVTPFKRELNNKYACYLVAYSSQKPLREHEVEIAASFLNGQSPDSPLWRRMVRGVKGAIRRDRADDSQPDFITGYVGIWFQGDEAHIVEIAVRESCRGKGIGELLLIGSLRAAVERGSEVMTLEARVSNFIAQRLYEKYGFKTVGTRKAYYSDNREDAVIMTTSPIHQDEYQSMFVDLQSRYQERWRRIYIED